MNTINVLKILGTEYGFEEVDTSCPFCNGGNGCSHCDDTGDCLEDGCCEVVCDYCEGSGEGWEDDEPCEECDGSGEKAYVCAYCEGDGVIDDCEKCTYGEFEIMWNHAFELPYSLRRNWETSKRDAWENGWLLFEYDNENYLAAGGCGYDFTWQLAWVAYVLTNHIPFEYVENLGNGGYVFVNHKQRTKIAELAAESKKYRAMALERDAKELETLSRMPEKFRSTHDWARFAEYVLIPPSLGYNKDQHFGKLVRERGYEGQKMPIDAPGCVPALPGGLRAESFRELIWKAFTNACTHAKETGKRSITFEWKPKPVVYEIVKTDDKAYPYTYKNNLENSAYTKHKTKPSALRGIRAHMKIKGYPNAVLLFKGTHIPLNNMHKKRSKI